MLSLRAVPVESLRARSVSPRWINPGRDETARTRLIYAGVYKRRTARATRCYATVVREASPYSSVNNCSRPIGSSGYRPTNRVATIRFSGVRMVSRVRVRIRVRTRVSVTLGLGLVSLARICG